MIRSLVASDVDITSGRRRFREKIRTEHLYQLIAYPQHEHTRQADNALCGMLIYSNVGGSLLLKYRLLGITVIVATIDLSQEWRNIEGQLHGVLDDSAKIASPPSGNPSNH